jgi:hypothetical protein
MNAPNKSDAANRERAYDGRHSEALGVMPHTHAWT